MNSGMRQATDDQRPTTNDLRLATSDMRQVGESDMRHEA